LGQGTRVQLRGDIMQNTIKRDLIQSIKVGFGFGTLFSLTSHFAGFPIESSVLWVIPFITGVLSALGSLVAGAVAGYLQQKWFLKEGKASALGFIAAAGVNAFSVILLLGLLGSAPLHRNVIMALVLGLSFGGIYALYAYRINRMEERMAFLETLAEKNKRIQEATRTIAIIQERNRMSRELHDSISQGLHGIYFSLHSLRKELSDPSTQVSRILNHLEETLQATQDELRAVIDELKPSLLTEKGLEQSLKYLGDLLAHRQQIPVKIATDLQGELSAETELALYRIAQEAFANIEQHAEAQEVDLVLKQEETGGLILTISDHGKGFDLSQVSGGNGLNNMKRRAEENGGQIMIDSLPGRGTAITVTFPPILKTQTK
jgi:signal transduction histidine kinase